jgi:hypothetical protein
MLVLITNVVSTDLPKEVEIQTAIKTNAETLINPHKANAGKVP